MSVVKMDNLIDDKYNEKWTQIFTSTASPVPIVWVDMMSLLVWRMRKRKERGVVEFRMQS